MRKNQEKKLMINTGIIRWLRYPIGFLAIIFLVEFFKFTSHWHYYLTTFTILSGIFYWLWNRRMLRHDSKNLYILRGKTETIVPLSKVVSIKRSRAKVNSSRYWILIYLNELKEEKKLRFDSDFNKPFFDAVRDNNPEVVIWEHPFFNH